MSSMTKKKEDNVDITCKREILLFVRLLKKYGIYEKFLHERYSQMHSYSEIDEDGHAVIQHREYVPPYDRVRYLDEDLRNALRDWISAAGGRVMPIGILIQHFDYEHVSFVWDGTEDGYNFWNKVDSHLKNDARQYHLWRFSNQRHQL